VVVHDLLSGPYRRALRGWPPPDLLARTKRYAYSKQGIGSQHGRASELKKILEANSRSRSTQRQGSRRTFTRRQLLDLDYNPLDDPAGPDRADLEARYGLGERRANLDHAAAVRGILVSEGKQEWRWIWDWGLLHDEMVRKYGYDRLYARYRNQYTFMPTIEFECPPIAEALRMLIRDTLILPGDKIQIVGWSGFRAFSIRDALEQMGEPLEPEGPIPTLTYG
jgi:hypothetical protein